MQWATVVVIEQMQRWRCPTYTPRTTVIAPYSSTEVVHALPEAEKHTLLFFRRGSHSAVPMYLIGFHGIHPDAHAAVLQAQPASWTGTQASTESSPPCSTCALHARLRQGSPGPAQNEESALPQHRGLCEACEQL